VVLQRQLHRRLNGFRPGIHEKDVIQIAWESFGNGGRQLDGWLVSPPPVGSERKHMQLRLCGCDQVAAAVPELGAIQRRQTIEVPAAIGVDDPTAVTR
jgi:hypothetical protein